MQHVNEAQTKQNLYIQFLKMAHEADPKLNALDPVEEKLLTYIALNADTSRLSVRDLMATSQFGSPAMIHGRLTSMREKGWLNLADTEDARRKKVELSHAALMHFDTLGEYIKQVIDPNYKPKTKKTK